MKARTEEYDLQEDEVCVLRVRVDGEEMGVSVAARDPMDGKVRLHAIAVPLEVLTTGNGDAAVKHWLQKAATDHVVPEAYAALLRKQLEGGV